MHEGSWLGQKNASVCTLACTQALGDWCGVSLRTSLSEQGFWSAVGQEEAVIEPRQRSVLPPSCPVPTPFHRAAQRVPELMGRVTCVQARAAMLTGLNTWCLHACADALRPFSMSPLIASIKGTEGAWHARLCCKAASVRAITPIHVDLHMPV